MRGAILKHNSAWRKMPTAPIALRDESWTDPVAEATKEKEDEVKEVRLPVRSATATGCCGGGDTSSSVDLEKLGAQAGVNRPGSPSSSGKPLTDMALSSIPTPNHRTLTKTKSALSLSSLDPAAPEATHRKTAPKNPLRFSSTVRVCLVPTREELKAIIDDLYFKAEDYGKFKTDAVTELREVLVRLGVTSKQAIEILYQPHGNDYYKRLVRGKGKGKGSGGRHRGDSTDEEATSIDGDNSSSKWQKSADGPSLSDDEDDCRSPLDGAANGLRSSAHSQPGSPGSSANLPSRGSISSNSSFGSMNNFEEGPNLSDDEDEREKFEGNIVAKTRELKFITGAKTDIELNLEKMQSQGPQAHSGGRSLPVVTPSGSDASANAGTVWYSKWQKSSTIPEDQSQQQKSAMAGSPSACASNSPARSLNFGNRASSNSGLCTGGTWNGSGIAGGSNGSSGIANGSNGRSAPFSPAAVTVKPQTLGSSFPGGDSDSATQGDPPPVKAMSAWQLKAAGIKSVSVYV